jgi:two-component system, NtrC family, sensor histidine kinase GlrK
MRLVSRLALSHTLPVGVMACALVVVLALLAQITSSLKEIRDVELGSLESEESIHRAAWAVEVAMRHGAENCEKGQSSANVAAGIRERLETLQIQLRSSAKTPNEIIVAPGRAYVTLASRAVDEDTCQFLIEPSTHRARERLDEQLTDAWISRTFDLHSVMLAKDEEARRAAARALSAGIILGLLSLLAAVLLAQRIARTVTAPLAELSSSVRRVGQGDFSVEMSAHGPLEVRELAAEMDAMRRRLSELESLKQGFLASVSHEMRTPLTKIREALGLLADGVGGKLHERQARIVEIARVACEREIRTVTTLLDLSRLRAGVPIQRRAGTSIDEVCRSAVRDEEIEAKELGVEIEVDISGETAPALLDTVLVERSIANVVRNAVSVSKKGQKVVVRRDILDCGPDGRRGAWARISVKDEGPGIPPELRTTLFHAFVTRGVESSPKRVGIGLGLALAREIARTHGGDIVTDDEAAAGAIFHIWLPLETETTSSSSTATS